MRHIVNSFFIFIFTVCFSIKGNVTSMGEWTVFTPSFRLHMFESESSGSYSALVNMGEQADLAWKSAKDAQSLTLKMSEIFDQVTPGFVVSVIEEILVNDDLLDQVVQSSYRNVTGFLKVVLVSNGSKSWKIRLHVWNQNEKEFPHNHKWDFYSKILSGYLKQTLYEQSFESSPDSWECQICEPVSLMPVLSSGDLPCPCRDKYVLANKQGTCSLYDSIFLRVKQENIIAVGESYCMPSHLIHTIASGKNSVTLVFTSEQISDNSEVFVAKSTERSLEKYAPSVSRNELIAELQNVKNILKGLTISGKYLPEVIDLEHRYFNKHDPIFSCDWRDKFQVLAPNKRVIQLNELEKSKYVISVSNEGEILIGGFNPPKDEQEKLFVLQDGRMYASPKNFAHEGSDLICHTSFTDYAPVDSAGLLRFDDQGNLIQIEAYSGHYAPSTQNLSVALDYLQSLGYDCSRVVLTEYHDRS